MLVQNSISLPAHPWQLPLPPLASSFSISVFIHTVLLTGGMLWAGAASRHASGPVEFEVVGLEAAFEAGVNRAEKKAASAKLAQSSAVDEPVKAERDVKQKTEQMSQLAQAASTEMPGQRWLM